MGNVSCNVPVHSILSDDQLRIKPITLRELTMVRFMNAVTDKPEWAKKVWIVTPMSSLYLTFPFVNITGFRRRDSREMES